MTITVKGPTPAGGVRSEAYLFAADGTAVDEPAAAAMAEVVEYAENGDPIARTYARLDGQRAPELADDGEGEDEIADAPKAATWDLTVMEDGRIVPVTTLAQLTEVMIPGPASLPERREIIASMLVLPMWEAAPAELRAEVNAWLVDTRPKPAAD